MPEYYFKRESTLTGPNGTETYIELLLYIKTITNDSYNDLVTGIYELQLKRNSVFEHSNFDVLNYESKDALLFWRKIDVDLTIYNYFYSTLTGFQWSGNTEEGNNPFVFGVQTMRRAYNSNTLQYESMQMFDNAYELSPLFGVVSPMAIVNTNDVIDLINAPITPKTYNFSLGGINDKITGEENMDYASNEPVQRLLNFKLTVSGPLITGIEMAEVGSTSYTQIYITDITANPIADNIFPITSEGFLMKNILFQNLFGNEAISIYADSQMFMSDYPFNKEQNMINIYNEDSGYDESLNNLNYKFYTINTKYVSFTGGNPAQNIVIIKIQYDPLSNLITDISEQYILRDIPSNISWRTLVSSNINLTYNDAINGGSDTLSVFGLIGNGGGNSILQNDTACGTIIYTDGSNDIIFNPNYGSIVVEYTSTQQTASFVLEEPTLPTQPIQPLNILPPPPQNSFENAYIAFNCGNSNIIALLKITYETNTNIVFSIFEIYRSRTTEENLERQLFYGSNSDYTYNPYTYTYNFINTLEYELYGLVSNSALQINPLYMCGKVVFNSGDNANVIFSAYSNILNYINIYQETATIVSTSPDIITILTHDTVIHNYNSVYVSFTGGLNSQIIVILKLTYMVDSGLITTIQEKFLVRSGNGMVDTRTLLTNTTLKSYIYNNSNNTYTFSETVVVDVFGLIGTSSSGTPLLNDNTTCGIIEFTAQTEKSNISFTPMITISDYAKQVQLSQFVSNEPDAPIQPITPTSQPTANIYVSFTGGSPEQVIVYLTITYNTSTNVVTQINEKYLQRDTTPYSYVINNIYNGAGELAYYWGSFHTNTSIILHPLGLIGTNNTSYITGQNPCGAITFSDNSTQVLFTPLNITPYRTTPQSSYVYEQPPILPTNPIGQLSSSVTQPSYAPKELNLLHDNETNKLRITAKTGIALQADSLTNVTPVNTNTFELATYELDGTTVSSGVYVGDIYTKMKNANNTDVNVNIGKELADIRSKLVDVGTTNIGNIVDHVLRIEKVLTSLTNVSFAPTSDFISINNLAAHDTP